MDLLKKYQGRYNIIKEFAPAMMAKEEVMVFIEANYAGIISTKNKGIAMKEIIPSLKGKADGKLINECVSELIQ